MTKKKKCLKCTNQFYGAHSYCSVTCRDTHFDRDKKNKKKPNKKTGDRVIKKVTIQKPTRQRKKYDTIKNCPVCNNDFQIQTKPQIYCSKRCAIIRSKEIVEKNKKITLYRIFKRDRFCCIYCGSSPLTDPNTKLVIDHVYPMVNGGTNDLFNLATCCENCNSSKHASMLSEDQILQIWKRNEHKNSADTEIAKNYQEMVLLFNKTYFSRLKAV